MASGIYVEVYLVDYARLKDGDPKSMQKENSCKQPKSHS